MKYNIAGGDVQRQKARTEGERKEMEDWKRR